MKLNYLHEGCRFFFVTIAIAGRKGVLSQLIDDKHRPRLLKHGEIAKSVLTAIHAVYPCATLSDFVIMPDHIHFLLIVNYSIMPGFNPLWVTHRVIDAIESLWNDSPTSDNQTDVCKNAVNALRTAVNDARNRVRLAEAGDECDTPQAERGFGGLPPHHSTTCFDRRVYIELSFNVRQLKTIRRYIRLNPARAIWKQSHPDRFVRFANIAHAVLDKNRIWDAMGNLTLLASPFLFHVRLTLKKTVADHEAAICEIVEKAKRGMIPVSGFISPGEVEALRRLKATPGTRFIKLLPCAMMPRYDPSAEDSRELSADRMLILSGFRNTNHISAVAMRRDPSQAHLFRANCLAMNDIAADLCTRAQTLC